MHSRVWVSAALLCVAPGVEAAAYSFTDLGSLDGYSNSYASAINNGGQIVGYSTSGTTSSLQATLWSNGTVQGLGAVLTGASSINDAGEIAGTSNIGGPSTAAIFSGSTVLSLNGLAPSFGSTAAAINDRGQVVGQSSTPDGLTQHAVLWTNGQVSDLGSIGIGPSYATGINERGQVVGTSVNAAGTATHAALWSHGSITDLGTLGGIWSEGTAINNAGLVVGYSSVMPLVWHAMSWQQGLLSDLGTLGGSFSAATAVNGRGQVVGFSSLASNLIDHATLWDAGSAIDLNTYLDTAAIEAGWYLQDATGINDRGWIVGNAVNSADGSSHAFLLTPVPEPSTYALMLGGLLMVSVWTRRPKADGAPR